MGTPLLSFTDPEMIVCDNSELGIRKRQNIMTEIFMMVDLIFSSKIKYPNFLSKKINLSCRIKWMK